MYESQFTYKKFWDDEYVDNKIKQALKHVKREPNAVKACVHIAYFREDNEKFWIGKSATNGHVAGKETPFHVLRVAFAYLKEESDETTEVWRCTSLYPVARADDIALTIRIK